MKKILLFALVLCLVLVIGAVELVSHWKKTTMILYCEKDVISEQVLRSFTKETGIEVQYQLPEDGESALTPAQCDLVLADAEQLRRMLESEQLAQLDWEQLDALPPADQTDLSLSFDPEHRYTVPGLWSTMGLLYNPAQTDIRVTSWSNLFDGHFSGTVVMPSDGQLSFAAALAALGLDVNTQSWEDLAAAASYLTQQQPHVAAYCTAGQLASYFETGKAILAPCYAGTAMEIMANLPELSFVIPSEGSWRSLFSYAIPADSQKQEAAYELLNFLCEARHQAQNATYSGYSVVSSQSFALLDSAWQSNPLAYPSSQETAALPVLQGLTAALRQERDIRWHKLLERTEQETAPQFDAERTTDPF